MILEASTQLLIWTDHITQNSQFALDLFKPQVSEDRFHPNFQRTLWPSSQPVRDVLTDWANGFQDRDGKFVKEFQTTYNSSFWELYLFAVLKHLGMPVDFAHDAPDFYCPEQSMVIEAITANHAVDTVPEWQKSLKGILGADKEQQYRQTIVRFSNSIAKKLKLYHERHSRLDHVRGRAFIIAVSSYATQDFHLLGDVAMQRLLYDGWNEEFVQKENGSKVRVGLFLDDRLSEVSAVIFSATATFGKARALSNGHGDFLFNVVRIKDNHELIHIVAEQKDYRESICDGLRLFINPFAQHSIHPDSFADEGIRVLLPEANGDMLTRCHPSGDLYGRWIIQRVTNSA